MTTWCLIPSILLYSLASFFYLLSPFVRQSRIEELGFFATLFGCFLQIVYLGYFYFYTRGFPFIQDPRDMLGFVSLGLILLFLWLVWRRQWQNLGSFFVPLAFILFLFSLGPSQHPYYLFQANRHVWLILSHILFASLSFILMAGVFVLGIAFLIHEKRLKEKKWDALALNLPPLLLNEKSALNWLRLGFIFLTIVLITGSMLMGRVRISFPWGVLHVLLAMTAWAIYAIVMQRRWMGANGRKILLLSMLGFVTLISSFLWS